MEKEAFINVMKRYEFKYRLSKDQFTYFKEEISKYMKIDQYGLTSIASLYFDTPDFLLINRSIEKPKYKEKLRLRSYGLANDKTKTYLEIKRKCEGIVYKRRISLLEDQAIDLIASKKKTSNAQINRELVAFLDNYQKLEAKYLIIYDRLAFYQDNSDLRITIDLNPRYRTDNLNLHTSMEGEPLLDEGEAILEIKVQDAIPLWLVAILSKGKIYQNSFSKVGTAHIREMKKREQNKQIELVTLYKQLKGGQTYGLTI